METSPFWLEFVNCKFLNAICVKFFAYSYLRSKNCQYRDQTKCPSDHSEKW